MPEVWIIILLHQFIFQGMFFIKNILLYRKTGTQLRGKNIEATLSIAFFIIFIGVALTMSLLKQPVGEIHLLNRFFAMTLGMALLLLNLIISAASLIHLKDSWRVGVLENQKTDLVTTGIYQFTRNPYFVSYVLMFIAYTVLVQNALLFGLLIVGCSFIHRMIIKEESYLLAVHGDAYVQYKKNVPRYIII